MPATAKSATLRLVERLEDDVSFEDIMYELHVLQKIEREQRDLEEGRTTPHEKVKDELERWLK